jgi:hypothetical protein
MRRRDFIRASAALGGAGLLGTGRRAFGAWGDAPDATAAAGLLGPGVRAEKCLELFLYGGMTNFESWYVNPDYGTPNDPDPSLRDQQWYLFESRKSSIFSGACGWTDKESWLLPWMPDSLGNTISLGPIVTPLRNRPDILDRMRIVVMRHDLEPHEAAIPMGLSGFRLGNPRMAGLGAHVQRYYLEREPERVTPFSYVFMPSTEISTDNVRVASSVGLHPGSARPLQIKVSDDTNITALIGRLQVGDDAAKFNPLIKYYSDRVKARYIDPSTSAPLRSRAIDDHAYAIASLLDAPNLELVLTPDILDAFAGNSCDFHDSADKPGMSLSAAVQLLQNATLPARYVNVIDGGLETADGGGGYDTHFEHLETQSSNLSHILERLTEHVNEPGEGDPAKLDLDETMVLITTEFGRTPYAQGAQGTNHFPYGYCFVMIGGPVKSDQKGYVGALGPDGYAVEYVTPSEFRAATLVAMGMWPFAQESFAVGDIRGVASEEEGFAWLKEYVLGVKS